MFRTNSALEFSKIKALALFYVAIRNDDSSSRLEEKEYSSNIAVSDTKFEDAITRINLFGKRWAMVFAVTKLSKTCNDKAMECRLRRT